MKRITIHIFLVLIAFSNTPIVALPLEAIAIIATNLAPYLGAKRSQPQEKSTTKEDSTILKENPIETVRIFQEQTARERTELIERFTNARKKVFGDEYFANACSRKENPWKIIYLSNGKALSFILDHIDDKTLMTTLGLYYHPSSEKAVLLQRRRVELPKSRMPLPGDDNYNNDQTYIDALTTDMDCYIKSSLDTIEAHIKNTKDPVEMYRKETQLIQ